MNKIFKVNRAELKQNIDSESQRSQRIANLLLVLAILIGLSMVTTYFVSMNNQINELTNMRDNQQETTQKVLRSLQQKEKTSREQAEKINQLEEKITKQEEILTSREGFLNTLGKAGELIKTASKKISIPEEVKKIITAQEIVYQERENVDNITEAEKTVKTVMASITQKVAVYDAAQVRVGTYGNSGNATGKQMYKNILKQLGGSNWVKLTFHNVTTCGSNAAGCASAGPYEIQIANRKLGASYGEAYNIVLHEYAHMYQFRMWQQIMGSPLFAATFPGEKAKQVEHLADCMAKVKKPSYRSTYGFGCNQKQLDYSKQVWALNSDGI